MTSKPELLMPKDAPPVPPPNEWPNNMTGLFRWNKNIFPPVLEAECYSHATGINEWFPIQPYGGGAAATFPFSAMVYREDYLFSGTTTGAPGGGQVRLNNSIQNNATIMWLHYVTSPGLDIKRHLLDMLKPGSHLDLQDKDNSIKNVAFNITGAPIDKTTYVEIPVQNTGGVAVSPQRVIVSIWTVRTPI